MAGPGYLIPAQDLLEGMEREQLAAGIRKEKAQLQTEDIPSASRLQKHTRPKSLCGHVDLQYHTVSPPHKPGLDGLKHI